MSSQPASQPDSIDLAYDMWAGQFEFVGPAANVTNSSYNSNSSNSNSTTSSTITLNNNNNGNNIRFGSDKLKASHSGSTESLEDLNLNFDTTSTQATLNSNAYTLGCNQYQYQFGKQPILIDQEQFLSLNPADFEDIVPSGPNSLVFIENKLSDDSCESEQINNNNNNNNNSKLVNLETLTSKFNSNKTNNTNTNGFKLENLKNFKNKLLCDFEDKASLVNGSAVVGVVNNGSVGSAVDVGDMQSHHCCNNKMNGLSAEMCDNLNEQLELLQRQVTDLADTQNIAEDRTTRTKTEYAVLQTRYHMLEEQYRESELRAEERLAEEQKRYRELLARVEREASLQNENCQIKIKTIELEANTLREEAQRLRVLCDKQANDLHRTEEKYELARDQIAALQQDLDEAVQRERKYEDDKKAAEELMLELSKELERLRAETGPALPTTSPETIRLEELHQELEEMRQKNKALEEQNEELQAQVLTRGVEEGRNLLNGTLNSLAQELEEMSQAQDSVDSATLASLSQLQQAFQEKEDENTRLKHYIDTILLNIVENYPQLLEVKPIGK
ncbi:probable serine/threonine-protein kinase cdc7 isoform X1 [Zeugodacus cucurbitae]|nr:probable serine/threonine-protein kinase cdc7 isoform X1 [Zeugodacus cucurbitae]XP_054085969.1 probable serine/threonine-protein kinase cdc7 isoform X1 [Zeugodacus cucurbitae]XP_054085970.1 probable serine/threonine-protein kinase cdc7 isoform X1 [Zeugodacus cucurbitae]XP_054085971.1 probable serine/threonine-protein kinase cdc7 isoform X1 [Zeugodacus cucurbitae]XP_054085973.1 probable serine/threonine-protein kinase cdc7 isoform X1 [Zeugodacus cucurbitae]XP_054085974.1 probable serine/thre